MSFPTILRNRLGGLDDQACRRSLSFRSGIDFSSSDYLGFSSDSDLKALILSRIAEVPLGATASRLLRGQLEIFEDIEASLAAFCGKESAILFPSGYQANVGLLSGLLGPDDVVFSDQFNHASIIDGIRLSRAEKFVYPHNDQGVLRRLLQTHRSSGSLKVIVTESVFSMEGDFSPLLDLISLAEEFSALLIVDEAHATGVWGDFQKKQGGGLVQALGQSHRVFATVHTGGKALGVAGAWVCGDAELKDYLLNFSRPFIFSTGIFPPLAVSLLSAIDHWKKVGPARADQVLSAARYLQRRLHETIGEKVIVRQVSGPITPVILGSNAQALQVAKELGDRGFDVRAIRPPTVPEGQARLRLTTNASLSIQTIEQLVMVLSQCIQGDCSR